MSARTLRIGTRASALALWQANRVAQLIRAQPGAPAVELVHIKTEGDVRTDVPLWAVGGRAFFTREIDRAQLAGEVDLAVHSLKDLSTLIADGLELAAVLEREDPRDALLTRQITRHDDHVPDQGFILIGDIVSSGNRLIRHDQNMHGGRRPDIQEGNDARVAVKHGGRQVAGDDFLEKRRHFICLQAFGDLKISRNDAAAWICSDNVTPVIVMGTILI